MKSPKLGVERRTVYKTDLDECPLIPWENLKSDDKATVETLSYRLIAEDIGVFDDIDAFFASLYGLNRYDMEVIKDTLETALPFRGVRGFACQYPAPEQRNKFISRLGLIMRPFLRKLGVEVQVDSWKTTRNSNHVAPYSIVLVGTKSKAMIFPEEMFLKQILPLANESGASRVILEIENGLAVAILNQQRYWTPSRARLCAGEILQRHMSVFDV
jgi:hypothetical protein